MRIQAEREDKDDVETRAGWLVRLWRPKTVQAKGGIGAIGLSLRMVRAMH